MNDHRPGKRKPCAAGRSPSRAQPRDTRPGGRRPGRPAGRPAFTLLEMLVAMTIMAVLAGSLYATLHVAFRGRDSATAAVEETRKVELALELLRADLQAAVVPNGILAGTFLGEPGTAGTGQPADTLMFHGTGAGTRAAEGVGEIRMVEFACAETDDETGLVLLRRTTTNLLAPTTPDAEEEVLCRGVRAFALRYFDGTDWLDTWDSTTQENTLPPAVEVRLELENERAAVPGEGGYVVTRVFLVPASSVEPGTTMEVPAF